MSGVKLENIVKSYGSLKAVDDVSLDIKEGEFLTFLGPSGCGKTTTLRLISGFVQPTSGAIYFGDKNVTGVAPQHRQIGMVFQDYALFIRKSLTSRAQIKPPYVLEYILSPF